MKSDHRHELKTNDLRKWAAEIGQSAGKYSRQILIAAVAVLVLVAGAYYWSFRATASSVAGWNEMAAAQTAEDYANIADKRAGTVAGAWARLREGEYHLDSGFRLSFTDRASGLSDLKKARESFDKIVNDPIAPVDVKERALFGLGRCLETLSDRNTDEAMAVYQRLVNDYLSSAYRSAAEARIAALRTGGAQEFYAWFHDQNPKPPDRELPRDLKGPVLPSGHPLIDGDGKADSPENSTSNEAVGPAEKSGAATTSDSSGKPDTSNAKEPGAGKETSKSSDGPADDSKPADEKKPASAPTPAKSK